MKELLEAGKVVPVIDRSYSLREVPEALRYLEEGHAQGKVVITVAHNNQTEPSVVSQSQENVAEMIETSGS
jgi:hypothetical protein